MLAPAILAALLAAGAPEGGDLAELRRLYRNLQCGKMLGEATRLLGDPSRSPSERAEVFVYRGMCELQQGHKPAARDAFVEALVNDARASLPPRSSPKVAAFFDEIRKKYLASHPIPVAPPIVAAPPPAPAAAGPEAKLPETEPEQAPVPPPAIPPEATAPRPPEPPEPAAPSLSPSPPAEAAPEPAPPSRQTVRVVPAAPPQAFPYNPHRCPTTAWGNEAGAPPPEDGWPAALGDRPLTLFEHDFQLTLGAGTGYRAHVTGEFDGELAFGFSCDIQASLFASMQEGGGIGLLFTLVPGAFALGAEGQVVILGLQRGLDRIGGQVGGALVWSVRRALTSWLALSSHGAILRAAYFGADRSEWAFAALAFELPLYLQAHLFGPVNLEVGGVYAAPLLPLGQPPSPLPVNAVSRAEATLLFAAHPRVDVLVNGGVTLDEQIFYRALGTVVVRF